MNNVIASSRYPFAVGFKSTDLLENARFGLIDAPSPLSTRPPHHAAFDAGRPDDVTSYPSGGGEEEEEEETKRSSARGRVAINNYELAGVGNSFSGVAATTRRSDRLMIIIIV